MDTESEITNIDPDDYDSSDDSSEYPTEELDKDHTANPHGFTYANMLDTYQLSRRDRIAEFRAAKEQDPRKKKFQKKNTSKVIGKQKARENKPTMMVLQKKI